MNATPRIAADQHPQTTAPINAALDVHVLHWLDAPDDPAGGVASLGGKAASLVRLLRAGLPVPPGFVVLPAAFVAESTSSDSTDGASVKLTPEAASRIAAAYAALGRNVGTSEPIVAVRSSATAEDLADASFAGQYDTYLGVRGAGEVLAHVERCAASLWSARAAAYRAAREAAGQSFPEIAMAVVVQALVDAEAAGVAFTTDPVAGDTQQVIVNGAWGLGQSIVDGEVEGDTWRVDRSSLTIAQETIGLKATRTGPTPDAPRVPVPEAAQRRPCLEPEQVVQVARLALRAEDLLGQPADVEWALADGQVCLLQARPITTLPAATKGAAPPIVTEPATPTTAASRGPTPQFPFTWPDAGLAALHWRLDSGSDPSPIRPWDEDERGAQARSSRHAAEVLGGERYRRALYLNGYRYSADETLPATAEQRERRRLAFEGPLNALQARGATYWEAVLLPEIDEGDRRLDAVAPATLSATDLAAHLTSTLAWFERLWTLHSLALRTIRGQPNTFRQQLATFCNEVAGQDGDDLVTTLVSLVPNKLSEAIDGLIDLARTVQAHPALRQVFASEDPTAILECLGNVDGGSVFAARLERLLAEQGLRSDAGAFTVRRGAQPGWRDRPALVITLVQRYVPQDLDALAQAHATAVAARDAQAAALRASLPDEDARRRFDDLLDAARREARAYEDHNYYIDCAAGALLHRALMAAARRLVRAGALPSTDDIWWLRHHEITSALQAFDDEVGVHASLTDQSHPLPASPLGGDGMRTAGARSVPRWDLLVQARRTLHEWQRSLTPPDWVGAPPPADGAAPSLARGGPSPGGAALAAANQSPAPPNVLIRGQPGSGGVVTGRVRLVPRDALVPEVEPGDVLVAHNAGVLWTPVFPVAAAVVLDEGVLFQHAMLTCREYGVPGIFQAKQATSVLHEGQRVTVDGTHGWVLPADDESSA